MVWPCKQDASENTPQTSFTCQSKWEKTSFGRRRTRWTNYNKDLGSNCLGLHHIEMIDVIEDMKCGGLISSCCPATLRKMRAMKKTEDKKSLGKFRVDEFVKIWLLMSEYWIGAKFKAVLLFWKNLGTCWLIKKFRVKRVLCYTRYSIDIKYRLR